MDRKGFTLVELIAVIALISSIVLIITPLVSRTLKQGSEKADNQTKESIELAAKNWSLDNREKLNSSGDCFVAVSTLQSSGYIDKDLKMPSTTNNIDAYVKITGQDKYGKVTFAYTYSDEGGILCGN
ncbi:MAG: prepilin-type N-terminal cleavage/methylation domain-containing protein [Bacilli bacterium]|nr:prepilin-type N-terminal cleavage/methylation domain-containing protein [Bacilli bacterium]